MKIKLFFILLLTGMGISVFAQNEGQEGIVFMENQPWSEVLQKAKEQNRLIFMDCYTVWCGPCKGLAKDIFPQKKVGDFFNARSTIWRKGMARCYERNTRSILSVSRRCC